jgi:pimeloyl-ACP methyl ester carboxylesterase
MIYPNPGKQTVLIFPQGIGNIDKNKELAQTLSQHFHVIHMETPGAGESYIKEANINYTKIAKCFYKALKEIHISKPIIFGESYGAFVALEFIKLMPAKKLVLQGFGDMFTRPESYIYQGLYAPFKYIKTLRSLYIQIIKHLKIVDVRSMKDIYQQNAMDRWWDFLNSRLKAEERINCPALIILSKWDFVVRPTSYGKFKKMFVNYKLHLTKNSHYKYKRELIKDNFKVIVDFMLGA